MSEAQRAAIGALIWKDPERILEAAARLRGSDATLECTLRGGSMGRAIPAGAKLRIAVGSTAPIHAGEVVAFVRADGLCVHRVARVAGSMLVTQGDACFHPDEPIEAARVLGPVSAFRTDGGWQAVGGLAPGERAGSARGRALLRAVTGLLAIDARLARLAARALRLRKESANAEPWKKPEGV